jgi:hypothetical protein
MITNIDYTNTKHKAIAPEELNIGSRGRQPTVTSKEDKSATGNLVRYSIFLARIDNFFEKSF